MKEQFEFLFRPVSVYLILSSPILAPLERQLRESKLLKALTIFSLPGSLSRFLPWFYTYTWFLDSINCVHSKRVNVKFSCDCWGGWSHLDAAHSWSGMRAGAWGSKCKWAGEESFAHCGWCWNCSWKQNGPQAHACSLACLVFCTFWSYN